MMGQDIMYEKAKCKRAPRGWHRVDLNDGGFQYVKNDGKALSPIHGTMSGPRAYGVPQEHGSLEYFPSYGPCEKYVPVDTGDGCMTMMHPKAAEEWRKEHGLGQE